MNCLNPSSIFEAIFSTLHIRVDEVVIAKVVNRGVKIVIGACQGPFCGAICATFFRGLYPCH